MSEQSNAEGVIDKVTSPSHASDAVASCPGLTGASPRAVTSTVRSLQAMDGAVTSRTVTLAVHVAVFPESSVALTTLFNQPGT